MSYEIDNKVVETDEEGFLINLDDWSRDLADIIATSEGILLTNEHWEIIDFLRDYYDEYQIAPAVRMITKSAKKTLGPDKGNSVYLYGLFPHGPGKQGCKLAGLPKPTGCI